MPLGEPTCSLCHYWLGNAPPYQAISYTWGGQTPSIPLNIDGNSMLVTPIVSDFIWHHASLLKEKYVWIDAVCINQSDLNEKTNQIQLMRDIYNGAAQVVIWLNATTLTKDATNLRAFLNLLCLAAMTGTDCRKNMESTFTLKEKEIALLSLNMFFSHSWFERIWVVQEISNDAKVFFVYGSMRIDWSTVAAAAVSLEAIRALRTEVMNAFANYGADVAEATATSSTAKSRSGIQHNNCTAMNHIKDRIQKKDPPTLGALLAWSIRYKATDRRDKVFAVIGMSKDGAVLLSHLGYESRTEDVFIHTARHILSHNEWPVVLYSAGCGYRHISTAEAKLQLPSWVPTWSQEDNVGVSRPDEFERKLVDSAELPSEVGVQLTEILLVIRIFGIQFDSIHLMGPDRRLLLNAAYGSGSKHEPDQAWGEAHDEHRQWHVDSRDFIRKSSAAGATSEAAADEELWQTLMSASNDRTPEYLARTKHAWDTCMLTRSKDITNSTDMEFFLLFSQMPDIMQGNLSRTITGKRLAVTKGGATALVPLDAEVDDIICWIKGTTLPFLLRSTKSGRYELVGTCYVHGAHAYTGWDWQSYLVE